MLGASLINARTKRPPKVLKGRSTSESGQPVPPGQSDRECLGRYPSLEAFARDAVGPLLRPGGEWLLGCLNLPWVLHVLAGADRLYFRDGRVYLHRRPPPASRPRPRR